MKYLASASFAVLLAIGATSMAQGAPLTGGFDPFAALTAPDASSGSVPYDHCHGRVSGTADASCGKTHTGGPSGGLF